MSMIVAATEDANQFTVKIYGDIEAEAGGTVSALQSEKTVDKAHLELRKSQLQAEIADIQVILDAIDAL